MSNDHKHSINKTFLNLPLEHAGHHHGSPNNHDRTFVMAIILNTVFISIEFGYAFIANSTALMADAGHNLSDVLGLLLAWGATILARKVPHNKRYTYGFSSSSILAALANAMLLLIACGAIAWEALQRFSQPSSVGGLTVTVVAVIGIIINGFSALLFMKGKKMDLNIRGAYLHMAGDALISLGVAVGGIAMMFTGWHWIDPVISLLIVIAIVISTWALLRESLQLALNAVPSHINLSDVESYLRQCPGVTDIHDLHIWGMSTTETALTVHLVMPNGQPSDEFLDKLTQSIKNRFHIQHSTLQIKQGSSHHGCALHSSKGSKKPSVEMH